MESAIFDSKLMDMGEWTEEEKNRLTPWTKIYKFDDKRLAASNAVAYLIPQLLNNDCTTECKKYARRLAEKLILFEDLLYTTRGGIAKKFYRDHLNHMLRTALLSRAIAKKVSCLGFDRQETKQLSIAALTHDISYPLAEASRMLLDTISAMEECYHSMKFIRSLPRLNTKGVLELFERLKPSLSGLSTEQLACLFESHNHGLLSALEFLLYVRDQQKYAQIIEAIALHDSELSTKVPMLKNKILGTLILCDEMQDWGRPASPEEEPTMAEIKNLKLEKDNISGTFDLSGESKVSPMRQICTKVRNLCRLDLTRSELRIRLEFALPRYDRLALSLFEKLLQSTFSIHPRMIRLPAGISEEMFLESYYGAKLPTKEKDEMVDRLTKGQLTVSSPFSQSSLYVNESRLEVIHTANDLGKLQSAIISCKKGPLIFELNGEMGHSKGMVISQKDELGQVVCRKIVGEIFIFHSILADIAGREVAALGLYFTASDIESILTQTKIQYEKTLIENLVSIHRCLQNGGFFSLAS